MVEEKKKKSFEDVISKLKGLAEAYGPKAMEAAKIIAEDVKKGGKIGAEKLKEYNLERQKLQLFLQLGKTVYQDYEAGKELDEKLVEICAKIKKTAGEIKKHNEEAKKISKTFKGFKKQ